MATVKPGSGKSAGRVNWTEGAAGRIHVVMAESTNPSPANPNKRPSPPPPVHGWQNGSYCPNCGQGVRVGGGCGCGTMKSRASRAQLPGDKGGTGAADARRSQAKMPSTPGRRICLPDAD